MKTYRLTKKGKVAAGHPGRDRSELLDFLHEHKTCTLDELKAVIGSGELRVALRDGTRLGLVEEVRGSDW